MLKNLQIYNQIIKSLHFTEKTRPTGLQAIRWTNITPFYTSEKQFCTLQVSMFGSHEIFMWGVNVRMLNMTK